MDKSYGDEIEARRGPPLPEGTSAPVMTWALLGANVVVWVAATVAGGTEDPEVLLDFGAMFGPLIASGEYWRLFTAMFLHVGFAHLALNGFGLYIFGPLVERAFGHTRFLTIYVLAGLLGSMASYLFNSISVGVGASGAIFGVLGALAAFFVAHREVFGAMARRNLTGLLVLAGINMMFGLITPGIDNAAHMGGFAAGFALGLGLAPRFGVLISPSGAPEIVVVASNSLARRWWVVAAVVALLLTGTWLAGATMPDNAYSHVFIAERYFDQQDYDLALAELDKVVGLEGPVAAVHLLRGRILADLGDVVGARAELSTAIKFGDRRTRAEAINLLLVLNSRRS